MRIFIFTAIIATSLSFTCKAQENNLFNQKKKPSIDIQNAKIVPYGSDINKDLPNNPTLQKNNDIIEVEKNNGGNPPQVLTTNDACSGATSLVIGVTSSSQPWGATNNIIAGLTPSCWSFGGTDAWYKFTVPAGGGNYSISVNSSANVRPEIALFQFSTACSATGATQIACSSYSSDLSATKFYDGVSVNCLTAGTYYIEVDCANAASGTFSILVSSVAAGPSNDCCSNAYPIPSANLNGTWNTGFTTVGATFDSYYSSACQAATNNVWFSFVAQGPDVEITVAGTSTAFEPEIVLASGTCSAATATLISCANDYGYYYSSISTFNNEGPNLVTGQTYYIQVTNEGTAGTFSIQVNNAPPNQPGTDCATGAILCTGGSYGGIGNLWGTQELSSSTVSACNLNEEINSSWYVINVLAGGSFTFSVTPNDLTNDYDYAVYSGATCTLGAPVSCNYSGALGVTGISTAAGGSSNSTGANGSTWNQNLTVTAGVYILYINGFTPSASPFSFTLGGTAVLGCTLPVILPIELLSFTANLKDGKTTLNWSTSTETNNSYFTIERSLDGKNFQEMVQVKGAGTSKETKNYSTIDYLPLPRVSYYRLSQTDFNGKTNLLTIISVNNTEDDGMFSVMPNPTDGMININYSCSAATNGIFTLYNINGSLVLSKEITCISGSNKTQLDLGEQPAGIYFVTFTTNDKFYRTKLIKK